MTDKTRRLAPALAMIALLGTALATAQPVAGDAYSTGFPAATAGKFVVREGQWFPIISRLTVPGSQVFQGFSRVDRADLDGDIVEFVERPVTVSSGIEKRVWNYAAMTRGDIGASVNVELIADDRVRVNSLQAPVPEFIGNDALLILDVSEPLWNTLREVDSGKYGYVGLNFGNRTYTRSICVANMAARDLPDRWFGLESVDVLVWDEPNPDSIQPAQVDAIIEWVKRGGQLVVGLGQRGPQIQKSALAPVMPLTDIAQTVELDRLPVFVSRTGAPEPSKPIVISRGKPADGAFVTFREQLPSGEPIPLVAMQLVGSGRVVACAARLRDLSVREFLSELIDLTKTPSELTVRENEKGMLGLPISRLYGSLIEPIEFRALASLRVLGAFGFVAAYVVLSTFATWGWLRRKNATQLSWSVFAGFAVVASVVSLGAVGLFAGFSSQLASVAFVDIESGKPEARAKAYFGYKSPARANIDLAIAGDGGFLRPLSSGPESSAKYSTPGRYTAVAAKGALEETPMRATLKQFEGAWQGRLEGTIRGQITIDRRTGKVDPASFIQNDLPDAISFGYLLYIDPRVQGFDGVPYRVAGMIDRGTGRNFYQGRPDITAAINVLCVPIGAIPAAARVGEFGRTIYEKYDKDRDSWLNKVAADARPEPKDEPVLPTLWHVQTQNWAAPFSPLSIGALVGDPRSAAAMLACTRNLYVHSTSTDKQPSFDQIGVPISTEGLMSVDVTHWLMRGQAIFLAISDKPGPTMLTRDGQPMLARSGMAVYRVRMPIEYTGQPASPRAADEKETP
ncbi:MAG: hypothetical protein ACKVS9_05615 [Phycisphaerae bacterium]